MPTKSATSCNLLIPDLLWRGGDEVQRQAGFPALGTLLSRATAVRTEAQHVEEWLCRAFAVDRQQDWPVAALTLIADGGNPGNGYWLRVDPVHLRADSNQLILTDARVLGISPAEADQLTQALNSHFSDRGLLFEARKPERWYLRAKNNPHLKTCTLAEAAGNNVDPFLPAGADGIYWHGIGNEIQMVLHHHAVNQARDADGRPAINSVWLWGGGRAPDLVRKPYAQVWSDECLARGLALASGAGARSLPRDAPSWLAQCPAAGVHLFVLDSLRAAAQYRETEHWLKNLKELEMRWFAPLLSTLQRGVLEEIIISTGAWSFTVARRYLWKLWRKKKALADYA